MKQSSSNYLLNISPIDGRYQEKTTELAKYFSEYAYIKYRINIEIEFLFALSEIKIIRKLNKKERKKLQDIFQDFNLQDAEKVKKIEKKTNHDVKAIEYFIKEKLIKTSLNDIVDFIHFGLTSEDTNNIAIRLMLKDVNENVILPNLNNLNLIILNNYKLYKNIPILARTHGQPAVPTTLGKEFLVFYERLNTEIKYLKKIEFNAKINGAVGNYNALYFAYPNINWIKFSKDFISHFNLKTNLVTTQIASYEDIIYFFQCLQRINGIILDFNQDMWRYISDEYFFQEKFKNEVGSSTMPQKINPINFENSEGNIIIANSLIDGFVNKLPISRLQRDLSGSTISRNFGVTIAHCLLAYQTSFQGLKRITPNKEKIEKDLNCDWSILSEAIQIYLKREGVKNGYELVKNLTRGEKLNKEHYTNIISQLPLSKIQKKELIKLTPNKYTGISKF